MEDAMTTYEINKKKLSGKKELKVKEVSILCGVACETVRKWLLVGLKDIPNQEPTKIRMADLESFLISKRARGRPRTIKPVKEKKV
jgi:hypothetical protein